MRLSYMVNRKEKCPVLRVPESWEETRVSLAANSNQGLAVFTTGHSARGWAFFWATIEPETLYEGPAQGVLFYLPVPVRSASFSAMRGPATCALAVGCWRRLNQRLGCSELPESIP